MIPMRVVRKGEWITVPTQTFGVINRPAPSDGLHFACDPPLFVPAVELGKHAGVIRRWLKGKR